ncbi:MAG: nitrogenase component 1, partial [Pseudomonadota bacterium]
RQPYTRIVPLGVSATGDFLREVSKLAGLSDDAAQRAIATANARLPWYSRSVDSTYFTGKRAFIFGDASHAVASARVAADEFGFDVVGLGTYSREFARNVREAAELYGIEALITDDYLEVEDAIAAAHPEIVLGTQMERHIAKRLGLPCAVISAPVHVQDFPARYSPQMGYEGANVLFDTWVHPLMMGLEEHLLGMFQDDFEFNDQNPSHLGHGGPAGRADNDDQFDVVDRAIDGETATPEVRKSPSAAPMPSAAPASTAPGESDNHDAAAPEKTALVWTAEAEAELKKIPFFVRGKAKRNTETFARDNGLTTITIETLYDAKSHFAR